jgi:cytidylate kinase
MSREKPTEDNPRSDDATAATGPRAHDVVAIDGPSGAGKSTVARRCAQELGWRFLDTGAMYRAVTLALLDAGLLDAGLLASAAPGGDSATTRDPAGREADIASVVGALGLEMPADGRVLLDGRDVSAEIRERRVEEHVSEVAAMPAVRARMRALQREVAAAGPIVAEGRDMTTVVFPEARFRIYLDASVEERARRRLEDFRRAGREADHEMVRAEIEARDHRDSTRADGPLRVADGAVRIVSDGRTADEIVARIVGLVRGAGGDSRSEARTEPKALASAKTPAAVPPVEGGSRGPRSEWFYAFCREVCMTFARLWFGLSRRGSDRQKLPEQGGVLIVGNHCSYIDPVLVGCVAKRPLCYLARSSLGRLPVLGAMLRSYGVRFLDRDAPSRDDLQRAIDLLRSGEALVIFPEGTRSRDGHLQEFKRGVLTIAKRAGVPVIPVGVSGAFGALPRGVVLPRPVRCTVRFGRLRPAAEFLAEGGLEALRREVAELSGQRLAEEAGVLADSSDPGEPGAGAPRPKLSGPSRFAQDVAAVDAGAATRRAR